MSRLHDLLVELVPRGVPFVPIGRVAQIASARIDGSLLDATTYVGVDNLLPDFAGRRDSEYVANSSGAIRFEEGDVLVGNIRPYLKKVWLADRTGGASPDVVTLSLLPDAREAISSRYFYFLIASERFIAYSMGHARGAKMPRGDKAAILKYRVPLPPREVQDEVVRVLNHFTELDSLLSHESEVRKRQRSELSRLLLNTSAAGEDVSADAPRVRLGEFATQIVEPLRLEPETMYTNLGVKWYGGGAFARDSKLGSTIKASKLYRVKPGQLIFNRMFVTEGSFAIVSADLAAGVVSNEFPVYELDETRVVREWLLLYLLDEYSLKRIAGEVTGTERGSTKSRRRWKEQQFEAFEIDLPSLEAQCEVLRVLGTATDLEFELRAEQGGRREQFAYYHERLLAFEEAIA